MEHPRRERHLLSEKELHTEKVKRSIEPVKKTLQITDKSAKVMYGVVVGLGKEVWRGLEVLGKEGQKSKELKAVPDMKIDLGFGPKPKTQKSKRVRTRTELRRRIRTMKVEKARRSRFG